MVLFCTAFIIAGYVNYQHTGVIFQPRYKAAIKKIGVDKFYKEAAVLIEERRAFDKAERAKGNDSPQKVWPKGSLEELPPNMASLPKLRGLHVTPHAVYLDVPAYEYGAIAIYAQDCQDLPTEEQTEISDVTKIAERIFLEYRWHI